jgi:hypothetical protein
VRLACSLAVLLAFAMTGYATGQSVSEIGVKAAFLYKS